MRFRFRIETDKIKIFIKMLTLLLSFSIPTLLLSMIKPEFFNMNFAAYSLTFSALYIFTIFPLKGGSFRKLAVLFGGNALSFIWNCLYSPYILQFFPRNSISNGIFQFINPVVNALWIVSMWAYGLSLVDAEVSAEDTNI